MGMQVLSLSVGAGAPAQQDIPHEKRPPAADQKSAAEQLEASLPAFLNGSKKQVQDLQKTTNDLEQISTAFDRRLKFIIDHESRDVVIKVIDNETDRVIKILPPEELQRLHSNIRESIGVLFDRMV